MMPINMIQVEGRCSMQIGQFILGGEVRDLGIDAGDRRLQTHEDCLYVPHALFEVGYSDFHIRTKVATIAA
jgi:hypothetical protein